MRQLVRSAVLAFLLLAGVAAWAEVAIPPVARVTDLTGTLPAAQQQALRERLDALEKRKGSQIAVLLVPTTQPEAIEQFTLRVAEQWKVGRKGVDDGALFVVAKDDRALRIEVGYGLEGALNDATAKRIIDEIVVPKFRAGDFAGGIDAAVDHMIAVIDGEALPAPPAESRRAVGNHGNSLESLFIVGFILVVVVGGVLRRIVGKVPAAVLVGGAAGVIAWFIVGALLAGVAVAVIAFVFTLAGGSMPVGGMRRGGFPGGGWGGVGGGGGSWGGGGGGFGGGGASGRW